MKVAGSKHRMQREHAPSELSDHDQMLLLLLRACNPAAQQIFSHVQGRMTRTMLSRVHTVSGAARLYVRRFTATCRKMPQHASATLVFVHRLSFLWPPFLWCRLVLGVPGTSWTTLRCSIMTPPCFRANYGNALANVPSTLCYF